MEKKELLTLVLCNAPLRVKSRRIVPSACWLTQ